MADIPSSSSSAREDTMEIGPIAAVRAVPMVKPSRSNGDLSAVFAVEFRKRTNEETYSSNQQKAARGLEDEELEDNLQDEAFEEDAAAESASSAGSHALKSGANKISFFA
jgi:hypothetical protein